MVTGPWLNFGLWLGDNEPSDDNVIKMTEPLYRALPKGIIRKWVREQNTSNDDLPLRYRRLAWKLLAHDDEPPRMRLVVSYKALERIVGEIAQQEQAAKSYIDDIQAKLDSYKDNEQRRRRLNALRAAERTSVALELAIEAGALEAKLEHNADITAQQVSDTFRKMAEAGKLPLFITVDGELRRLRINKSKRR